MTTNLVLEKLAIDHANHVSDPEWESWHGRQASYKSGYTRAIADVVEWFKSLDCACCEFCEQSSEVCFSQEIAEKIENKFLKGEK